MRHAVLLSFLAALSILPRVTFADHRSEAADAQRRLEWAEARLQQIICDLDRARSALNNASNRRNAALASVDSAAAQSNASAQAIANAQNALGAHARDAQVFAQRVADARAAFAAAKQRLDAASAQVDRYRTSAIATFESSPAFVSAQSDLARAGSEHEAEVQSAIDWLRTTDIYADIYDDIEALEAEVTAARSRTPADPLVLSAASQAWMDAKNALSRLKADYLATDQYVLAARQRLDVATAARQALVDRFNKDLAADQNLSALLAAAAAVQTEVAKLAEEINAADALRLAAENQVAQLQSVIASEQARLDQANHDYASLRGAAESAGYDIANLQADVQRLCAQEQYARSEHQQAAAHLRHVIELANAERAHHELEERRRHQHHRPTEVVSLHRGGFVHVEVDRARVTAHEQSRDRRDQWNQRRDDHDRRPEMVKAVTSKVEQQQREARGEAAVHARQEQERKAQEAAQQRERAGRAAQVAAAHDREARDRAAREAEAPRQQQAREKDAHKRQTQETPDRHAREMKERQEREAAERAQREAAAQRKHDGEARQIREREARESTERQARERETREARDRQNRDREASESRERERQQETHRKEQQEQQRRDESARQQQQEREQKQQQEQKDQERRRSDDENRARKEAEDRHRDRDSKFRK